MKKLFAILLSMLFVAVFAGNAGAWMTDAKDYNWTGEHRFEHKITIPSGTTVIDSGTHSGTRSDSGTITDTSTTTATGTYDYSGATSFDYAQSYQMRLKDFFVGDSFALFTASASTTAPYLALAPDSRRPAITWASGSSASIVSSEFRIPAWLTGSGLALRAHFVFTGTVCTKSVNWKVNANTATGAHATPIAQTEVSIPLYTTSSQYVATFTPNASAIAALLSGSWFNIEITPVASQSGTAGVTYLTGIEFYKP